MKIISNLGNGPVREDKEDDDFTICDFSKKKYRKDMSHRYDQ